MVFKTWLSDINKVALAMDSLQSITQFKTGSTIANGMELSTVAVNKYKTSIEGLSLSQAKTALSTTALNEAQQNQILISAGLLKTTESLTLAEIKEMASSMSLSAQKKEEILTTLQGAFSENEWNKERLEAIVLEGGEAGAIAEVILAKKAENAENLKNIASNKALTAVLKEQLIALASNPITWIVAGLAGTAVVLHNTSKAIDEVRQSASELNNEFSDSKSSVDGYKTQINDLYKIINDSGSSLDEVTTARKTLMTVQDELIDKFGDEKETIDLVTEAINGQSSALDTLTQKKWQETKNKFNESDIWNDYANWQEGYSDNIDRMVHEMENAWGNIKMSTSDYFGGEYDEIIKRLEEAGWKYSSSSETFVKGGSVEDLYEEILNIQTLVGDDIPDNFLKSLTDDANELKATLDNYEGMWDNYILNDKIFADDNLADSWKEVNDAYTKYQNAVTSGDKTAIEEATSGFATSINEVLNDENVSDSVKDYFKDMYPALYREVEKWEFKTNIIPEFDTKGLNGKTQADILEMLQTDGTQDGEDVFNSIVDSAIKYGLILDDDTEGIQKILDLLIEWGILQGTITDNIPKKSNIVLSEDIGSIESYKTSISSLTTTSSALATVLSEQASQNYITSESYDELIKTNSEFANALEYGSGYMRINSEKAIELAEANAKVALAELEVKEALEVQQYNENAKEIDQLENSVTVLTQAELDHLNQLKAENSEIEGNIRQYDLLESQIEQTLSGYNRFRQALETPNQDDAYLNIIEHLQTMKELYDQNLIGYDEFQAGMSAYIGENASIDDFANSYKQLTQYFTEGQEGFDKFMNDLVKVGELQLDTDGNIVGDLDWESAKKSLAEYLGIVEITDEAFQALIGRGEAYGAVLSTSNGVDGIEDLTQAQNELNASIEGYKKVVSEKEKAGLDTSAEEAKIKSLETQLETTTQKIEEFSETEVEGEIKFDLDAELAKLDTSNLSAEAQSTLNQLNATNEQIKLNAQMGVDTTYLEGQAKTQLNLLKEQMNVPVEVSGEEASETIDNLTISSQNATLALKDTNTAAYTLSRTSIGDLGLTTAGMKATTLLSNLEKIQQKSNEIKNINIPSSGSNLPYAPTSGVGGAYGTVNISGSAHADGHIGTKKSQKNVMVSEIQPEMVVDPHKGEYTIYNSPTMLPNLPKDAIVFNGKQTEEILKNGMTSSFGKAYANGNVNGKAYADTSKIEYKPKSNSTNTNNVNNKDDSSTDKANDKTNDKAKNLIDWIARRLEVLQTKADRWAKIIENATNEKKITKYYNKLESVYKKQMKTTFDGASRYLSKANSIKLDADLKAKVRSKDSSLFTKDGNLKSYKQLIKNYGEKTYEAITQYQDWYDKYQSCIDSYIEATENLYNAPLEEASAKIELLADSLELLDAKLENATVDGYKDANDLIDQQVKNQQKQKQANETAYIDAESNFNKTKKPFNVESQKDLKKFSDLKKAERQAVLDAVKTGQEIDITLFKEGSKGYKKALAYNAALQARNDAEKEYQLSVEETAKIEREAEKQKFDNIAEYYESKIGLLDHQMQDLDNKISEIESAGATVNKTYYEAQKQTNADIKKQYEEQKTELEKQLVNITAGTEEWYEAKDAIQECENAISDCNKKTLELNTSIRELYFKMFEDISEGIRRIATEQELLQSLFAHEKTASSETGSYTDAGIARLGSTAASYYAIKEDNANNVAILNEFKRMIDTGEMTSELLGISFDSEEQRFDAYLKYLDKVNSGLKDEYNEMSKLADLEKERYQAELDMLRDLIDSRIEYLDVEKELHDYANTINDKVSNIDTIQKQISAYQGDSSQEGMARLQKLQKELSDAQKDLEETEYDKYISDQKELFEGLFTEAEELIAKKMDDFYGLFESALGTANSKLGDIGAYLSQVADDFGYQIQEDGTYKLKDGEKSLVDIIKNIAKGIEKDVKEDSGTKEPKNEPQGNNGDGNNNANANNSNEVSLKQNEEAKDKIKSKLDAVEDKITKTKVELEKAIITETNLKKNKKASNAKKERAINNRLNIENNLKLLEDEKEELLNQLYNLEGFSTGGIAQLLRSKGEDGIAMVRNGEGLIAPENVSDIQELLKVVPQVNDIMQPLITLPETASLRNTTFGDTIVNIEMNGVNDVATFSKQLEQAMKTPKVQKQLRSVTTDRLGGSSRLGINTIK